MTIEISRLTSLTNLFVPTAGKAFRTQASTSAGSQADTAADAKAMQEAAAVIQDYLSGPVQPPSFNVDYLSGLNVMTVRSANNGEVVFQMPGPAAVRLAQLIKEGVPAASNAIVNETA